VTDWDVEDTSVSLFEFQNESRGVLTASRAAAEYQDSLDIYGSAGSIHVPVLSNGSMTVYSAGDERREDHPPHPNLHLPYIRAVSEAFLVNKEPPVPGETGLRIAEIIEEIYGS
jgi:predicted dehydrogenase